MTSSLKSSVAAACSAHWPKALAVALFAASGYAVADLVEVIRGAGGSSAISASVLATVVASAVALSGWSVFQFARGIKRKTSGLITGGLALTAKLAVIGVTTAVGVAASSGSFGLRASQENYQALKPLMAEQAERRRQCKEAGTPLGTPACRLSNADYQRIVGQSAAEFIGAIGQKRRLASRASEVYLHVTFPLVAYLAERELQKLPPQQREAVMQEVEKTEAKLRALEAMVSRGPR